MTEATVETRRQVDPRSPVEPRDPTEPRNARGAPEVLAPFVALGVLGTTSTHAAQRLCRLAGDHRDEVLLAAALAVRAPTEGHVCVDLHDEAQLLAGADLGEDVDVEALAALPWPEPDAWYAALRSSPLVLDRPPGQVRPEAGEDRPLCLVGDLLYLDRYWRHEARVAGVLGARAGRGRDHLRLDEVRAAVERLLPLDASTPAERTGPDLQRVAVVTAALRDLTVIAGGPGTGKTHTVARALALLRELHAGSPRPGSLRVAACAPTGKAADQLTSQLRAAADEVDTSDEVRSWMRELQATTIHRLLGSRPGTTAVRHDRTNRLPHDVVVVDETSMVALPLMARLLSALAPTARLVLVGDPDQLASVEAGAVLADLVDPAREAATPRTTAAHRDRLAAALPDAALPDAAGPAVVTLDAQEPVGLWDSVVVLERVRRFDERSGIARLAGLVHDGDADAVLDLLAGAQDDVTWLEVPPDDHGRPGPDALAAVRGLVEPAVRAVAEAAAAGDDRTATERLDALRVLCAHRRGTAGVTTWVRRVEAWTQDLRPGFATWYPGRPVMVTRNDPRLGLFNGDVGVTVRAADGLRVAFRGSSGSRLVAPSRLGEHETVFASTIHKSQGSQFAHTVVVLPDAGSPVLTRELLYTGLTRARTRVTVVGSADAVAASVRRRVARASGLGPRLWGR